MTGAPDPSLPRIQSLWIGSRLSPVERLGLASFVSHGHPVRLYTYEQVEGVPAGVELADASTILPPSEIYGVGPTIDGARSVSSFADWFRVELLARSPGIWVDLDVVCLRPFDFTEEMIFGAEVPGVLCNAVLRLPAESELLNTLLRLARDPTLPAPWATWPDRLRLLRDRLRFLGDGRRLRSSKGWGGVAGPRVLTAAVRHLGLLDRALAVEAFYQVHWSDFRRFLEPGGEALAEALTGSYAAHLWNERWRVGGLGKWDDFPPDSFFEIQRRRYL